MRSMPRNRLHALIAAAAVAAAIAAFAPIYHTGANAAEPPVFTGLVKGVAVGGYDPVAYFTAGKPAKGDKDLTAQHEGATWRFASAENRTAFEADPAKYAPRYGGYCAWAVSKGYTAKGDPEAWTIHEGRLYLNYDKSVRATWEKDIPGNVKKADANWPDVLKK
jgi:YHS domain-containing protein